MNTLKSAAWSGVTGLLLVLVNGPAAAQPTPAEDPILALLQPSRAFEQWRTTNALPDFAALPATTALPDPLRFAAGGTVAKEEWPKRRQQLLEQLQYFLLGSFPSSPKEVRSINHRSREQAGAFQEELTLEFGPSFQARLGLELLLPKAQPPFPVVVVPGDQRTWALVALSRGYAVCLYAGHDRRDDTGAWTALWPNREWGQLARRAWAIGRAVDYLATLPFIDSKRIALAGHGRAAQVALAAAALDQRIAATVASSSGTGGACGFRLFAEPQLGPGLEALTRLHPGWWHPRLRCFAGREHLLPVDVNLLLACVAPRPCLLSAAIADPSEDAWAIEQTYYSAVRVFDLLGRPHDLNLHYRAGTGELLTEHIETHFDWLDTLLGRNRFLFPDSTLFPTYASWQRISGEQIDPALFSTNPPSASLLVDPAAHSIAGPAGWGLKREAIRQRVLWSMGQAPSFVEHHYQPHAAAGTGARPEPIEFGNSLRGHLYFPSNSSPSPAPVLIWLHPASVSTGYRPPFFEGIPPHLALSEGRFAVFAFDQIGYGERASEIRNFYPRYPRWSLLGKMVEDTLAAVEALRSHPRLDPRRIYLLGYGQGGWIALHAAALDERVAGVITVAGLFNTQEQYGDGALSRWSSWLPLAPRLGAFVSKPEHAPYHDHDLLALIAPRPAIVLAPRFDRLTPLPAVERAIEMTAPVYTLLGARSKLQLKVLDDYHRFTPRTTTAILEMLPTLLQVPLTPGQAGHPAAPGSRIGP